MKCNHSLEMLTNKLQNKFQLDMWKRNEIHKKKKKKTPNEWMGGWKDGYTDITVITIIRPV
jgi:hypothetical protein